MNVKTLLALAGVLCIGTAALAQPGHDAPKKDEPKKEAPKAEPKKEEPKKEAPKAEPKKDEGKGAGSPKAGEKDIVDTAMGTGMHGKLCAALKAAGWVEPLKGKGPFTVFAPTDEAFGKLKAGVWDSWLKPENKEALANVLKYHVIQGAAVKAEEVMKMKESANTVQGSKVTITVKDGKVWLNGSAMVTKADVACSNGVIHVIDNVLMVPEAKKEEAKKEAPKAEPKKEEKKDEKKH